MDPFRWHKYIYVYKCVGAYKFSVAFSCNVSAFPACGITYNLRSYRRCHRNGHYTGAFGYLSQTTEEWAQHISCITSSNKAGSGMCNKNSKYLMTLIRKGRRNAKRRYFRFILFPLLPQSNSHADHYIPEIYLFTCTYKKKIKKCLLHFLHFTRQFLLLQFIRLTELPADMRATTITATTL